MIFRKASGTVAPLGNFIEFGENISFISTSTEYFLANSL
jgi:hypothetical protein